MSLCILIIIIDNFSDLDLEFEVFNLINFGRKLFDIQICYRTFRTTNTKQETLLEALLYIELAYNSEISLHCKFVL